MASDRCEPGSEMMPTILEACNQLTLRMEHSDKEAKENIQILPAEQCSVSAVASDSCEVASDIMPTILDACNQLSLRMENSDKEAKEHIQILPAEQCSVSAVASDSCEVASDMMPAKLETCNQFSLRMENSNKEAKEHIQILPAEILASHIFPYLDGVTFMRSRRVCRCWKEIVDTINTAELWNYFYENEFGECSESTLRNFSQETVRFQLYQTLHGWQHIGSAYRKCYYLEGGPSGQDVLRITSAGLLVTIKRFYIQFFDLNTFLPHESRQIIEGNYLDYQENDLVGALLCNNHDLHITTKIMYAPGVLSNIFLTDVFGFFLDRQYLYFHVNRLTIFRCKFNRESITECLGSVPGSIMQMNIYRGKLYVRNSQEEYWVHAQSGFAKVRLPYCHDSLLGILGTHNNDTDKKAVAHSIKLITACIEVDEPISCTLTHNDMLILGTYCGQIFVYCLKSKLLLLRFQTQIINGCKLGMRAITRIQVHESQDGYSFITTTAIGNCVTFYHLE